MWCLTSLHLNLGVLSEIKNGNINGADVIGATLAIAKQTEEQMGGTSGALYSYVYLLVKSDGLSHRYTGSSSPP